MTTMSLTLVFHSSWVLTMSSWGYSIWSWSWVVDENLSQENGGVQTQETRLQASSAPHPWEINNAGVNLWWGQPQDQLWTKCSWESHIAAPCNCLHWVHPASQTSSLHLLILIVIWDSEGSHHWHWHGWELISLPDVCSRVVQPVLININLVPGA